MTSLIPPQKQITPFNNSDWQGAVMVDSSSNLEATSTLLLPETIEQAPILKVLRDKRNKIWNIDSNLGLLTIKLNRSEGLRKLGYYFKNSKGQRHWDNAISMLEHGVNTPFPLAYFARHQRSGIEDSYYITDFIDNAFSSRDVFASINAGEQTYRSVEHAVLLKHLADFICNMHNQGILHRDLSSGNILLTHNDDDIQLYYIDIGRARTMNKLSTRQRLVDLMRICYKLPWSGREELINYYNARLGHNVSIFWPAAVRYYIFKQRSKRFVKSGFKSTKKK